VAITSDFMMNINRQRNNNKTQKRKKEMRQKYFFLLVHTNTPSLFSDMIFSFSISTSRFLSEGRSIQRREDKEAD
jgi:hypothetical protein